MAVRTSPHFAEARAHGHPIKAVWLPAHPNQQEVEDPRTIKCLMGGLTIITSVVVAIL